MNHAEKLTITFGEIKSMAIHPLSLMLMNHAETFDCYVRRTKLILIQYRVALVRLSVSRERTEMLFKKCEI